MWGLGEWGGLEFGEDEVVDGVVGGEVVDGFGGGGAGWGFECPVVFEWCALVDPVFESLFLFVGKVAMGVWWGHDFICIVAEDALDEEGFGRVAGDDGLVGALALEGIELEVGFALVGVLAVAVEAVFREDGADVAVVGDGGGGGGDGGEGEGEDGEPAGRELLER